MAAPKKKGPAPKPSPLFREMLLGSLSATHFNVMMDQLEPPLWMPEPQLTHGCGVIRDRDKDPKIRAEDWRKIIDGFDAPTPPPDTNK